MSGRPDGRGFLRAGAAGVPGGGQRRAVLDADQVAEPPDVPVAALAERRGALRRGRKGDLRLRRRHRCTDVAGGPDQEGLQPKNVAIDTQYVGFKNNPPKTDVDLGRHLADQRPQKGGADIPFEIAPIPTIGDPGGCLGQLAQLLPHQLASDERGRQQVDVGARLHRLDEQALRRLGRSRHDPRAQLWCGRAPEFTSMDAGARVAESIDNDALPASSSRAWGDVQAQTLEIAVNEAILGRAEPKDALDEAADRGRPSCCEANLQEVRRLSAVTTTGAAPTAAAGAGRGSRVAARRRRRRAHGTAAAADAVPLPGALPGAVPRLRASPRSIYGIWISLHDWDYTLPGQAVRRPRQLHRTCSTRLRRRTPTPFWNVACRRPAIFTVFSVPLLLVLPLARGAR